MKEIFAVPVVPYVKYILRIPGFTSQRCSCKVSFRFIQWQACNTNLNPIDHSWDELKPGTCARLHTPNSIELINVPQHTLANLVGSKINSIFSIFIRGVRTYYKTSKCLNCNLKCNFTEVVNR